MMTFSALKRGPDARRGTRSTRPTLENLESRELLYATLGGSWTYGSRITYSFVPDGTNIGGVSSNLYASLDAKFSRADWTNALKKSAAMWSSYANINLAYVSDDGSALSSAGNQQGDARFGDIRISMIPQGAGALGLAMLPPPYNGGTAAGDIVLNSDVFWAINTNYDLQTVAMHEMGHALGLDHTAVSSAVMYAYYNNVKQSLSADDVAGIQSIYGAYPADPVNDATFAYATNLTPYLASNAQAALGGRSLAGASDADFYSITVPANTNGTLTVSMQSTNLSSVSPRLTVYNGAQAGLGMVTLANSFGATATFTVTGVTPGQTYYFRASAASAYGSFGSYAMLVNLGSASQAPVAPPNTTVPSQPSQGGGSINQELGFIQVGNVNGIGDTFELVPGYQGSQPRYDEAGWSILLAGAGYVDNEVAAKVVNLLGRVNPANWNAVLDSVLENWGDSAALWTAIANATIRNKRG